MVTDGDHAYRGEHWVMGRTVNHCTGTQKNSHKSSTTLPKTLEEEGTLPNSFYEANITPTPKPDEDTIRKENHGPTSLMNVDAELLHRTLAKTIQQHSRRMIHQDQAGFIPGMRAWGNIRKSINTVHHIHGMKRKNTWLSQLMQRKFHTLSW